MKVKIKIFVLLIAFWQQSCQSFSQNTANKQASEPEQSYQSPKVQTETATVKLENNALKLGVERLELYQNQLIGKKVGLVVNQTSMLGQQHIVDFLNANDKINVSYIFAPEHGFRGTADAGESVKDGVDTQTGVPVISLYGKKKAPTAQELSQIDVLIFDIQDVGVRFYTYISTLHYVMKAAAENNVKLIVLDRPNPNGHYVDGPVLDPAYQSFVGMHPVPVVHGMTVGEYAQMINGQGWLGNGLHTDLTVVPCLNYKHTDTYVLPIKPSPNLPNERSIYLYPSLCFFEGTVFSVGRGTNTQFQIYGHPDYTIDDHSFTPKSMAGAKYPKHENKVCKGRSLTSLAAATIKAEKRINLSYLITAYTHFEDKQAFFLKNKFIDKLAGTNQLRLQIQQGLSEEAIRASWQADLKDYDAMRQRYLMY